MKATADADIVAVGITHYAQDQLGDIVLVELPKVGATYGAHDTFGTIEAVKAVSELYSPLAGEVVEVNAAIDANPAAVNSDPYGAGYLIKLKWPTPGPAMTSLLSAEAYKKHIGE